MISWIAVDDLVNIISFALENNNTNGTYNAVAPHPVTQKQLMEAAAKVKGGIYLPAPAPGFVLKIILGEMSIEVLKSCTVSAQKLEEAGYNFKHRTVADAIASILS